ncbi:hypothetical protein [Serratia microhaemolytica]|uniref:hypothetical protein n=1 Tax=Serratia microhaemolytica TaxID=2675110 RepID=UPI000FDDFD23|nr:hypothetical protein [Serratia microhaemolytica]
MALSQRSLSHLTKLIRTATAISVVTINTATAAPILTAVVPTGAYGIVGATTPLTSYLEGSLNNKEYSAARGLTAITTTNNGLCESTTSGGVAMQTVGVYGFRLYTENGTPINAVLLPDGRGTFQRTQENWANVDGYVAYIRGLWFIDGTGGIGTVTSHADGTSPYSRSRVACPNINSRNYDPSAIRSSSLNVRFLIDTDGSVPAGRYYSNMLYHGDFSFTTSGNLINELGKVEVVFAPSSCSLNVPGSVDLVVEGGYGGTARISYQVQCSNQSAAPVTPYLTISATGQPLRLAPDNRSLRVPASRLFVVGNWSSTVPTCSGGGNMYFDGQEGVQLPQMTPNGGSINVQGWMSFRLCGESTGEQRSTQAILTVIQR